MSHYAASKAAISVYVEGLHKEVRPLGIRCIAFECGGMPTSLGQPRDTSQAGFGSSGPGISAYEPLFTSLVTKFATTPMTFMPGDPAKAAVRIVDVVRQEGLAEDKPWAVRVALGSDGMGSAKQRCEEQLELIARWEDVSTSVDRDGTDGSVANTELLEFTTVLEK
jgi:NAD(P)-dependent dehydrogenase (short-subunit alcohol dehydrogenase family)